MTAGPVLTRTAAAERVAQMKAGLRDVVKPAIPTSESSSA